MVFMLNLRTEQVRSRNAPGVQQKYPNANINVQRCNRNNVANVTNPESYHFPRQRATTHTVRPAIRRRTWGWFSIPSSNRTILGPPHQTCGSLIRSLPSCFVTLKHGQYAVPPRSCRGNLRCRHPRAQAVRERCSIREKLPRCAKWVAAR